MRWSSGVQQLGSVSYGGFCFCLLVSNATHVHTRVYITCTDQQDREGNTALHLLVAVDAYDCIEKQFEGAKLLVDAGADITVTNLKGETALGSFISVLRSRDSYFNFSNLYQDHPCHHRSYVHQLDLPCHPSSCYLVVIASYYLAVDYLMLRFPFYCYCCCHRPW